MAEDFTKVKEESPAQDDGDLKSKENEPSPDDRGKDTKDEDSREWKKSGTFVLYSACCYLKGKNRGPLA